jgi:ABC-type multidrug transport system ATPase subunit
MNFIAPCVSVRALRLVQAGKALNPEPISVDFTPKTLNILSGPNGSGKTTLLDILALRTKQPPGLTRSGHSAAEEIAYLPQQFWDVYDIRVADLLSLAMRRGYSVQCEGPRPLTDALSRPRRELGALSSGQRQVLLFWLVSSQKKQIYIYDEPLRHLDMTSRSYVIDTIETQVKRGMLVILSEHACDTSWHIPCDSIRLIARADAA